MRSLLIILFAIQSWYAPLTVTQYVSGQVSFKNSEHQHKIEGLYFFVMNQNSQQIIASDYIDNNGKYHFMIQEDLMTESLRFYYAGNGFDTTYVRSVSRFLSDNIIVDFQLDWGK